IAAPLYELTGNNYFKWTKECQKAFDTLKIEKGQAAVEKIKSETGNQNVEFLHLNLKSLKSVIECAENFLVKNLPLHILINNAGITTKLLLTKIKASQPARIVNVSSRGHLLVKGGIEFEKLSDPNAHDAMQHGAITALYCATSPEIEEKNYRGRYFDPFGIEGEKSSCAKDDNMAKKRWEFTENLIKRNIITRMIV
ncbi:18711_t:CDS:2, partial [Gigaspora rosea]